MKLLQMVLALAVACGVGAADAVTGAEPSGAAKGKSVKLKVGTFDSRAVAVAFFNSEMGRRHAWEWAERYEKAKAAKDETKQQQLEAERQSQRRQIHMQGFSTASVANILDEIKDQIPGIAHEAGVDLIVSKWEIAYQAPGAELVDVTDLMVKPFHTSEKALGWIQDLKKHPPVPAGELKQELDEHLKH